MVQLLNSKTQNHMCCPISQQSDVPRATASMWQVWKIRDSLMKNLFYFSLKALRFITLPGHLSTCALNSSHTQVASACTQKCGTFAGDLLESQPYRSVLPLIEEKNMPYIY